MTDFQYLARGIALAGCGIGAGCALIAGIGPGIGAVSYTHLDVYKRQVQDSLITEGCKIYGNVKHSVLSAGVVVEEGATVEDAVLMDLSLIHI